MGRREETVVLGVEVGTTTVKVGAFDTVGHELASVHAGYRLYEPHPGFAEQDPHELADATLAAIREAGAAVRERGAEIAGPLAYTIVPGSRPVRRSLLGPATGHSQSSDSAPSRSEWRRARSEPAERCG
jgi:hypothetical protein